MLSVVILDGNIATITIVNAAKKAPMASVTRAIPRDQLYLVSINYNVIFYFVLIVISYHVWGDLTGRRESDIPHG